MKYILILIIAGAAVTAWIMLHPAHDCSMLARNCPSHEAVWVPNGHPVPQYGLCACAATVTVTGG